MREIRFRAWNGKYMIDAQYGDWISFDGVPYTESERKYDTPNIEITKAKGYVLMQFTGLHDKHGKEIYELHEINNLYRVTWLFNRYVLHNISNSDIFEEMTQDGEYEITREYCPMEKD